MFCLKRTKSVLLLSFIFASLSAFNAFAKAKAELCFEKRVEEGLVHISNSLSTIEGPLAAVVSQTMHGSEQASKTMLLGDAGLHDMIYAEVEKLHKETNGQTIDARKLPHRKQMWRHQPGIFTHLLIYRSASEGSDISQTSYFNGTEAHLENPPDQVTPSEATQMVNTLEDLLYDQYRDQGDFDEKREALYRQQGRERANYTIATGSMARAFKANLTSKMARKADVRKISLRPSFS